MASYYKIPVIQECGLRNVTRSNLRRRQKEFPLKFRLFHPTYQCHNKLHIFSYFGKQGLPAEINVREMSKLHSHIPSYWVALGIIVTLTYCCELKLTRTLNYRRRIAVQSSLHVLNLVCVLYNTNLEETFKLLVSNESGPVTKKCGY